MNIVQLFRYLGAFFDVVVVRPSFLQSFRDDFIWDEEYPNIEIMFGSVQFFLTVVNLDRKSRLTMKMHAIDLRRQ
jgi:hypothetical protein